ncbi:MAG: hypothetical protein LBU18_01985 [Treponema sp.]|jgi:hypothetical protein|nr:hypothetical protein [Treponema sp.]
MDEANKVSVDDLLHEQMKYLAEQASQAKAGSKEEKAIIGAMENLQCLMSRLDVRDRDDPYLDSLAENRGFLRLFYDSKVLVLANTRQVTGLTVAITRLIDCLEADPKLAAKMRRSVIWRLFQFVCRFPWGR